MNAHHRPTLADLASKDETILRLMAIIERQEAVIARLEAKLEASEARVVQLEADNARLTARVAELEAKLGIPPKTPDNSSVPPSKANKPSSDEKPKDKRAAHPGAHRPLHPNPTVRREFLAERCPCGANVSAVDQSVKERYDHVEIPKIEPIVTRVEICGAGRVHAAA
jgi:transposase